jgi:hypothetical protein
LTYASAKLWTEERHQTPCHLPHHGSFEVNRHRFLPQSIGGSRPERRIWPEQTKGYGIDWREASVARGGDEVSRVGPFPAGAPKENVEMQDRQAKRLSELAGKRRLSTGAAGDNDPTQIP